MSTLVFVTSALMTGASLALVISGILDWRMRPKGRSWRDDVPPSEWAHREMEDGA